MLVLSLLAASLSAAVPAAPAPPACAEPIPELYRRVSPAVVAITAMAPSDLDVEGREDRVAGSGVLIDRAGLVLTNSHVVFGRRAITVKLDDGTALPGQMIGADPIFDLAVVRIPVPESGSLPVATLGRSASIQVGDEVFAIGNPFGLEQTMSRGIVSAVNRVLPGGGGADPEPLIQTDAPINPGNSGGPLINRCGEVIGITTSILAEAQNIGFAIPSDLARDVVPSLVAQGHVVRPWIGIEGQPVFSALKELLRAPLPEGLLIEVVAPGSPADKAGVRGGDLDLILAGQPVLLGGDVVVRLDGIPLDRPESFGKARDRLKVGATVHLTLVRDGKTREVDVPVLERPFLPGDVRDRRASAASALARPVERRRSL